MIHYYAFIKKEDDPIPFFERTFGAEYAVLQWIKDNKDPLQQRFFTVNCLPKRYWY